MHPFRSFARRIGFPFCIALLAGSAWAQATVAIVRSAAGPVEVVQIADGLDTPWSLAFLPDGRMLVTERPGRLRIVARDGSLSAPLAGVPAVYGRGQGGLLDVVLGPDFATDRRIWFSYAEPTARGARTAVARAVLDLDGLRLTNVERIFAQNDDPSGGNHWGSRLVFGRDGLLYVTLGDRFNHRDRAQDLDSHLGKVVRIAPDGSVPPDNPFVGRPGALPETWSYGHRNVQGAALHPQTGALWAHEHGPQGGDEVNIVRRGRNYGWPVVTYGREYVTGFRIGEGTARADVEAPLTQWTPSIAPSGMAFYTGDAFPRWRGSLFVGALRGSMLVRLALDGERVVGEERLLGELGHRIRDVRQGPDGLLYLLDETDGRILRLQPARP
ncbi:PQQ-dependent sugar dehydrogenase [Pseudothauera rhizosphaerae]|uniref:PQQ-dependent sugar dehydrogenase n=1 Tax=Pseudothauera rhizosphaerae TaxID=2565932 RepID=A0A4S4ATY8_9RHOO|nr:PQQ-dependent sugar dehydrogenase [Pseudothauera rhizosphaerae]THF63397.1 PQQ-dependent sugar dehydrogenase [Pseudothauera rhizosphaerae]